MIRVTVDSTRALKQLDEAVRPERFLPAVEEAGRKIVEALKKVTPVSKNPLRPEKGGLRKGWDYTVKAEPPAGKKITLRIINRDRRSKKLLKWLTEGTRRHVITGRRSPFRMLRFWSAKRGKIVFASRVMHPGTKKDRRLTDVALDETVRIINAMMEQISRIAAQKGSGG